jgi:hypothetical protein
MARDERKIPRQNVRSDLGNELARLNAAQAGATIDIHVRRSKPLFINRTVTAPTWVMARCSGSDYFSARTEKQKQC